MIIESCRWLLEILIDPNKVIYRLWELDLIEARSGKTLNIEVVGNSISILKRVKTQNFDTKRKNQEVLKLIGFLIYDFQFESIFKFLLDGKFSLHDWFSKFTS
jgi:hypothetical protein